MITPSTNPCESGACMTLLTMPSELRACLREVHAACQGGQPAGVWQLAVTGAVGLALSSWPLPWHA